MIEWGKINHSVGVSSGNGDKIKYSINGRFLMPAKAILYGWNGPGDNAWYCLGITDIPSNGTFAFKEVDSYPKLAVVLTSAEYKLPTTTSIPNPPSLGNGVYAVEMIVIGEKN